MSAVQERLQLSRTPLDTWSKREQLCLASAVSCSGDQNWISVSRTLKTVCGGNGNGNGNGNSSSSSNNNNTNINNRPADWYSQKNCAVQYGHMLESVETTKRKKRTSESSVSSPATVEPPTELLLRRLTEERMQEIKAQMQSDMEMYRKVQLEIDALQSDNMTEQELQEMWQEIEKAQEAKRIEEMTMENRLREREQRKKELAVNWRQGKRSTTVTPDTNTTAVDMDVEQLQQQQPPPPPQSSTAPSPLLTSLLSSSSSVASSTSTSATVSVARTTAPTITSLLTSGPTSIPNQPAIKGDLALMTRPISGPPASESLTPNTPTTPGKSPSQAAPTLSMLLEQKNKGTLPAKGNSDVTSVVGDRDAANKESTPPPVLTTTPATAAAAAATATATATTEAAGDEADPNEEQLLEVFQNIMMNDIDIDMEDIDDEILKNVEDVDATSPTTVKPEEDIDFEDKLDALKREEVNKKLEETKPVEVVIGSSDDSNDNVPLATVATHDSKDRDQPTSEENVKVIESTESTTTEPLPSEVAVEEINATITLISSSSEDTTDVPPPTNETKTEEPLPESKKEDQMEKEKQEQEELEEKNSPKEVETVKEESEEAASSQETQPPTEAVKSVEEKPNSGTDEESSSLTDGGKQDDIQRNSKTNKQQQTHNKSLSSEEQSKAEMIVDPSPQPPSVPARTPLRRKLPHRDGSESPLVDDETTTASDHSTARSSTRRRCSSTPVIDSIPNSPASSEHNPTDDRRETRAASRKLFLTIYSTLLDSKHSSPFRRPFHDEHAQRHAELCLRPVDLPTIKRNIDSGVIRNINELHRDILLMTQNILVAYKPHTTQYKTAQLFWTDCQAIKEFATQHMETTAKSVESNTVTTTTSSSNVAPTTSSTGSSKLEKDKEKPNINKARSGSRKSQRHH